MFLWFIAFDIIETALSPKASLKAGDKIILSCKADGYFEYCDWYHDGHVCKFEWKRWHSEVRKQSCYRRLRNRIKYIGNYEEHECTVELKSLDKSDSGNWTCKVEGYGFFTRGDIVKRQLSIEVSNDTESRNLDTSNSYPTSIRNGTTIKYETGKSSTTKMTEKTMFTEG